MFLEEDHNDQRSKHAPQSKGKQEQAKCGGDGESKVRGNWKWNAGRLKVKSLCGSMRSVKVNGAESEMRGKWNWNGRKLKWDMNNQLKANAGIIDVATDESIGRRIVRKWRNRKRRLVWVERLPSPPPDHLRVEWGQQEERVKAWKWEERTFYGPPNTKWYKLFVKSTWCKYPLGFSTFQKHRQGWDLSDLRTFRHSDGEIYTIWVERNWKSWGQLS